MEGFSSDDHRSIVEMRNKGEIEQGKDFSEITKYNKIAKDRASEYYNLSSKNSDEQSVARKSLLNEVLRRHLPKSGNNVLFIYKQMDLVKDDTTSGPLLSPPAKFTTKTLNQETMFVKAEIEFLTRLLSLLEKYTDEDSDGESIFSNEKSIYAMWEDILLPPHYPQNKSGMKMYRENLEKILMMMQVVLSKQNGAKLRVEKEKWSQKETEERKDVDNQLAGLDKELEEMS